MPREEEFSRLMQAKQIVVRNKLAFAVALFIFFGIIAFVIAAIVGGLFENEDEDGGGSTSPSPSPSPTPTPTPTPSPAPTPTPTPTPTPPPPAVYVNDVQPYRITREDILGMAIPIMLVAVIGLFMGITGTALSFFGFVATIALILSAICLAMAIYGYTQGWPYISRSKNYSSFIEQNESTKQFASKGTTVLTGLACCFAALILFYLIGDAIDKRVYGGQSLIGRGARRARSALPSGEGVRRAFRGGLSYLPYVKTNSELDARRQVQALRVGWLEAQLAGRRLNKAQNEYVLTWARSMQGRGINLDTPEAQKLFFQPSYNPDYPAENVETMKLLTDLYYEPFNTDVRAEVNADRFAFDFQDSPGLLEGLKRLPKKKQAAIVRKKTKLNEEFGQKSGEVGFGETYAPKEGSPFAPKTSGNRRMRLPRLRRGKTRVERDGGSERTADTDAGSEIFGPALGEGDGE